MEAVTLDMTIDGIHQAYRNETLNPQQLIEQLIKRSQCYETHNVWTTRLTLQQIQPYLDRLMSYRCDDLPLYGIPFAIKDNIDCQGIVTTAACEEFQYLPDEHAYVVNQLIEAGAIPLGKTNLDQFATGLVGTRSPQPWGICKNSINPEYISGGSSSGSAVAVALGLASFALGTDTAGSGRVPAAFNNIVGLKPSKGLISTRGVVPACRSLDCVSIFSLTTQDANTVFEIAAKFDKQDSYARPNIDTNQNNYGYPAGAHFCFATPHQNQLEFFDDQDVQQGFQHAIDTLKQLGGRHKTIDFSAFFEAGKLLYQGPWIIERSIATEGVSKKAMLPVISSILATQKGASAEDLFKAQYKLQACYQCVQDDIHNYDFILTPTAGTIYSIKQVQADPIELNNNLGYYTNFMNLLDCCAVAAPAGFLSSGLPYGVTFFSHAFNDTKLLSFANLFQHTINLPLGSSNQLLPKTSDKHCGVMNRIEIVVCGAHLEGLPLNWQLTQRGAKLVQKTRSSANYRLYALSGGPPYRPGMVRDEHNGESIEVEIWSIPTAHFGSFVAGIPAPLAIGKIELQNQNWYAGFICESYVIETATDITHMGGWRNYIQCSTNQ